MARPRQVADRPYFSPYDPPTSGGVAVSLKQLADRFSVSSCLIRRRILEGKIPAVRVGAAQFVIPVSVAMYLVQYGLDALSDREYHLPPLKSFRYANWQTPQEKRPWHVAAVAEALGLSPTTIKKWIRCELLPALSIGSGRFVIPASNVAVLFRYGPGGGIVVNDPPHRPLKPWKSSDLAKRMGVTPQTVKGWIKVGKLPAIPMGGRHRIRADVAMMVAQLGIKGFRNWAANRRALVPPATETAPGTEKAGQKQVRRFFLRRFRTA